MITYIYTADQKKDNIHIHITHIPQQNIHTHIHITFCMAHIHRHILISLLKEIHFANNFDFIWNNTQCTTEFKTTSTSLVFWCF